MAHDDDPTYPPLDAPKPVAKGVWIVDSGPHRALGLSLPVRMAVLRLGGGDGGLWLHSPTRHTPALQRALEQLGPIRHLVAPTTAHGSYLADWQAAVPQALLWAAPSYAARIRRGAAPRLRLDRELGAQPPSDWRDELDQALFAGPGFDEVAFLHRDSRTLVLTDLVQAIESERMPPLGRLLTRAMGNAAPGGTPLYLRWLLRRRLAANRATAERVVREWRPRRVLFAHGAWFAEEDEAASRLEAALGWLLPSR